MPDQPDHRGIGSVGDGASVHHTVEVFGGDSVRIGAHSRIDCFAVVTAGPGIVDIADSVHIAAGAMIFGSAGVTIGEGAALSARVMVFSKSDYPAAHLCSPLVPDHLTNVRAEPVIVEPYVTVGAGSVILPGVRLGYACSIGAMSLVKDDVEPYARAAGTPARQFGRRDAGQIDRFVEEFAALRAQRESA
jgi:galactoside O-acetyltransferase